MKQSILCFLIRENQGEKEILLGMKKRDFGIGKWNGIGGKFNQEKGDKDIADTAIRETEEEIGVKIENPTKMAALNFRYLDIPKEKEWDQDVFVFFTKEWTGRPKETNEMAPKWFKISEIPYDQMWVDDKHWLPLILKGAKIEGEFIFKDRGETISKYKVKLI